MIELPVLAGVRVAILHYTPPGVIGGVEHVIREHVRLLEDRGARVTVIAGRRGRSHGPIHVIREMDAASPLGRRIEDQLAAGRVEKDFFATRDRIRRQLDPLLAASDVLMVHNAFTLHFSLPLTAALGDLVAERPAGSTIAWTHDLAWTNSLYLPVLYDRFPWNLLRRPIPGVRYVTVSHERKAELAGIWGGGADDISVIPNGIDAEAVLGLSRATRDIVSRFGLFDCDAVLLLPVRITRRKNIELGIRTVGLLKDRGLDVRFLISGPVAPHHPRRSAAYLEELKALRDHLDLADEVIFLADVMGRTPSSRTVNELYRVADVLFFPSAQEGFGLPVLEAGLMRVPAIMSAIPIFRELGGDDVRTFSLDGPIDTIAGQIVQSLDGGPSRLFRRVLHEYRWDAIVDRLIIPLIAAGEACRV